jgi:hypothetical protein
MKSGKTVIANKQELNCDKNWYTTGKKQSVTAMKHTTNILKSQPSAGSHGNSSRSAFGGWEYTN